VRAPFACGSGIDGAIGRVGGARSGMLRPHGPPGKAAADEVIEP
jgi:hypothetical protein